MHVCFSFCCTFLSNYPQLVLEIEMYVDANLYRIGVNTKHEKQLVEIFVVFGYLGHFKL